MVLRSVASSMASLIFLMNSCVVNTYSVGQGSFNFLAETSHRESSIATSTLL